MVCRPCSAPGKRSPAEVQQTRAADARHTESRRRQLQRLYSASELDITLSILTPSKWLRSSRSSLLDSGGPPALFTQYGRRNTKYITYVVVSHRTAEPYFVFNRHRRYLPAVAAWWTYSCTLHKGGTNKIAAAFISRGEYGRCSDSCIAATVSHAHADTNYIIVYIWVGI